MPGQTPCAQLPYPVDSDSVDVAGDMAALALAVDTAICGVNGSGIGVFEMWYDNGGVTPPGTLRCDGSTFDGATYPDLEAHLGSTTLPDFRGRFPRGTDEVGGPFPGEGQTGGWADAQIVEHDHSLAGHKHTINHDHTAFNATGGSHNHSMNHDHGAANTGNQSASHEHRVTDASAAGFLKIWNSRSTGSGGSTMMVWQSIGATAPLTWDTASQSDSHTHSFNMPNYSGNTGTTSSHTHSINVPNYSGESGQSSGNTGLRGGTETNRNIPPFLNVTFIITAVKGTGQ